MNYCARAEKWYHSWMMKGAEILYGSLSSESISTLRHTFCRTE